MTRQVKPIALNPPPGECRQCWLHAHDSQAVHAHLAPREDCNACLDHLYRGHPPHMIVQ